MNKTNRLQSLLAIVALLACTGFVSVQAQTVEDIASVTITGADVMTFGADPDTPFSNPYQLTITGSQGTTITEENISSGVTDFNVVWDIDGFKTANDTQGQYCDSYGAFSVNNEAKVKTTFELRNVPMNFFGKMTATVTYNGKTFVAAKYVIALGNKTKPANRLFPAEGYPTDFSTYPDALTDYVVSTDTYGTLPDLILGGWCLAGSDGNKSAVLKRDADGTKYVSITAGTVKKSHMLTRTIAAPTSQVIFKSRMRFNDAGAAMTLTTRYPFWSSNSGYTNPVTLMFNGTNITLNGTALGLNAANVTFTTGNWYEVVLSVDKTTESCYALVCDDKGTLLAQSGQVAWTETSNPTYFNIGMDNGKTGSVDLAACEAYVPTIDTDKSTLTADKTTLSIPNGDTATLTASFVDANGYAVTQEASWSVLESDMQGAVVITPSADSHVATVSLTDQAQAGTATIQATVGGSTKSVALNLTSSAESIKFTASATSITIPFDGAQTATFAASVVDAEGKDLEREVTLAAFKSNGTSPFTNTAAISFDAATGVLTVTSAANATTLIIRATGVSSTDTPLSKDMTVNIHGLTFDFGYTDEASVEEGYTPVGPSTTYNATAGYGIRSGSPATGGTTGYSMAGADYLKGNFRFDVKVQKGAFYTVTVTYQGVLSTGYINSDLAGFALDTKTSMTTAKYTIPATTDIIDLSVASGENVSEGRIAKVTITKQADRKKRSKRKVHHIGDSTSANNGSWAYRLSKIIGSTYPELYALCDFANRGAGGRNLCTYYAQKRLYDVLVDIYPGDIVMFGNNGTNGMGNTFKVDVNYYLDAAEALGAQIILNSYTPHGAVGNWAGRYNKSTHTFNCYRTDSYDVIVRQVAAERAKNDPDYLGFVEIGKNADAAFNAYVADYAANGYGSADAAAQAIISCFTDHNHYSNGTLACDLMLNGYGTVKGIVAQLVELLQKADSSALREVVSDAAESEWSVYNLKGQRVRQPISGLYVINGKKVFVR